MKKANSTELAFFVYSFLSANFVTRTGFTLGVSCGANFSAEVNNTVAEVIGLFRRQDFTQLMLHLFRLLRCGDAQTVGNPDAVGIADHTAGDTIQITQQQVGSLSAYTGNFQQFLHSAGNFSTVIRK